MPHPLHPAVVHFPIVLAILLPLVALVALFVIARGGKTRTTWLLVVAASAALTVSSWVAVQTGQAEEETVESFVSKAAIHDHEEAAEAFTITAGFVLLLALGGLAGGRPGRWIRYATVAGTLVLLVLGYRAGEEGGRLVYEQGAAQAYLDAGGSAVSDRADHDAGRERSRSRRPGDGRQP